MRNQVSKGTCFEFDIPVVLAGAPDRSGHAYAQHVIGLAPDRCTAPDGSPFRVLVVDDDPANRVLLTKLLTSLDEPLTRFEVRDTQNGYMLASITAQAASGCARASIKRLSTNWRDKDWASLRYAPWRAVIHNSKATLDAYNVQKTGPICCLTPQIWGDPIKTARGT